MNTVVLKHMNYMFSTSEVYFHRQNTLNLTNTNLARRGKNNNPFKGIATFRILILFCVSSSSIKQAFNIGM